MNRVKELNHAYENIEDFCSKLGEIFYELFIEEDNGTYQIAKSIISVFDICKTERDIEIADSMLIAICGYGIDSLITKIAWKEAELIAIKKYEEDTTEGAWEEADKYEREDYHFSAYFNLIGKF